MPPHPVADVLAVRPAQASLSRRVVAELLRGAELLARLTPPPPPDEPLERFRAAFQERYGDREVALAAALDEDLGIPLGGGEDRSSPLLSDIPVMAEGRPAAAWRDRERRLLELIARAERTGSLEIALGDEDLAALEVPGALPLPDAFAVVGTLVARSAEDADQGRFRVVLETTTGPSGARLLGRFCHADPALHRRVEAHLRAEEALRPDCVFAEVVHRPEGRVGNVVLRPVLRSHEIPYLGASGAPPDRQLLITDLRVRLEGGRFVLRSTRLDREVVPRLTTAHNFGFHGPAVYRFLCALQSDRTAGSAAFSWGALGEAPFLPRIVRGRAVLFRACWRLRRDEARRLGDPAFRRERRLPRLVALLEADQALPLDLENAASLASVASLLRGREEVKLVELLPGPEELCARSPEGGHVHELIVPFVRERSVTAKARAARPPGAAVQRTFPPGSEWLTAKIYCGTASADRLLVDVLWPLARRARGWFFLRYADPGFHLRLRLRGEPRALHGELLEALRGALEPAMADGRVHRLVLDTYEREVERYGGPAAIEPAEEIFQADSEAVVELLGISGAAGGAGADLRWRLALVGMRDLASALGLEDGAQLELFTRARAALGREMKRGAALEEALSSRFRRERAALEALLASPGDEVSAALARRRERMAPAVRRLRALEASGDLEGTTAEVAHSFLHMHANRMLRSAAREQELVLHDFLARLLRSRAARAAPRT